MAQDENETNTVAEDVASIRELLEALVDTTQEQADTIKAEANSSGLGSHGARPGRDAQKVLDQLIGKLDAFTKKATYATEAMDHQIEGSNRLTKSIKSGASFMSLFSKEVKSLFFGKGELFRDSYKKSDRGQQLFYDGLIAFNKAMKSPTLLGGIGGVAKGLGKFAQASFMGAGASVLGTTVGAGIGLLGYLVADQVAKAWQENKEALFSSVQDARQVSFGAGYPGMVNGSGFAASDYMTYRRMMRLRGLRNDAEALEALRSLTRKGVAGESLTDAVSAAVSNQALKQFSGVGFSADFISNMYRATYGNKAGSGMWGPGYFNVGGVGAALSRIVADSRAGGGAGASLEDLTEITQALSKNFLGMNNSMPHLLSSLRNFATELGEMKVNKDELLGMYTGTNTGMNLDQRLMALSFRGVGSGNLLEEAWKWNERARTSQGIPRNLRFAAQSALQAYRGMGGTSTSKDIMQMFSEGILSQFGLGALKDHPNMIPLLQKAAAGDSGALEEMSAQMRTDGQKMDDLSRLLDAIRNPVTHMRDYLLSQLGKSPDWVSSLLRGRAMADAYSSGDARFLSGGEAEIAERQKEYADEFKVGMWDGYKEVLSENSQAIKDLTKSMNARYNAEKNTTAGA